MTSTAPMITDTTAPPAEFALRLLPARPATRWQDHLDRYGRPHHGSTNLIETLSAAMLLGRGGAGFPTGQKLAAVATAVRDCRLPAVVIANCCEGDPTSVKDEVLIGRSPHLVIDGALAAATAVGADRLVLAAHDGSPTQQALAAALAERPGTAMDVQVVGVPDRYIASEATSLVRFLNTGDARPAGRLVPIWESGIDGRPTLVDNAETLAHLALLDRFGPAWFAGVGTAAEPGTTLVTISGAVPRPGVVEVAVGTPLAEVLACAGAAPAGWALLGGLAGRWIDLAVAADIPYSTTGMASIGATRGVSSIIVLPPGGCLLTETARILQFAADTGARQCGPCMFGLPAIAADMAALLRGDRGAQSRLQRRLPVIAGRGGCGHPDGAVGVAASALQAVTLREPAHLHRHLATGDCPAPPPVVPLRRVMTRPAPGGRP